MANKGDIHKVALPNGDEYNFKDKYVRENYRALNNNDFDTINVTELNSGNLINTGAARFLNTINGSISGNAATATKATQDESGNNIKASYASSFSISDHTITLKNKNGASLCTVTVPDNNTTYTLGTSGNNVTLTPAGGTAQSITVPYATTATTTRLTTVRQASANLTASGVVGVSHFVATSSMTTGKPPVGDGHIIHMSWDNTGGWDAQLAVSANIVARVAVRGQSNGTWGDWYPIGRFTQTTPTSGQVVVTDGTTGEIKSSGYTIEKSVPSDAK